MYEPKKIFERSREKIYLNIHGQQSGLICPQEVLNKIGDMPSIPKVSFIFSFPSKH